LRRITAIITRLEQICMVGSAVALLAIMALTTIDVTLRKTTNVSIPGLYELTEDYFMVGLVFLSMGYVYRTGGHVRVSLFQRLIPKVIRFPLEKVLGVLAIGFFGLMAVLGWQAAQGAWEYHELSSSVLAYPLAPALFMVPAGAAMTCLRIFENIISKAPQT
jgi:TRAP-type C4-dicarboxylate transport system permease small subunit